MTRLAPRRHFLKTTATTGALWAFGDLSFLSQLPAISRADARLDPKAVRLQPEIEPLVRLLEDTPREQLLGESSGAHQTGFELSGTAGGVVAGWCPQHSAAARRFQVSRGARREFRPPGEHCLAGFGALAANFLGARLFQGVPGPRCARGGLDDGTGE